MLRVLGREVFGSGWECGSCVSGGIGVLGLGSPLLRVPLPCSARLRDPRELACGQLCLVKAGAGSLPHCGASPRGGCAGKVGTPIRPPGSTLPRVLPTLS